MRGRVPSERPGSGGGKGQRNPRRPGLGGPRLLAGRPASVPKVGGEPHLDSGPSVRAATARVRLVLSGPVACARVATSRYPQPAGGATGRQREPVSPFISPRPAPARRRRDGRSPRYVRSVTPAPSPLRRRAPPVSHPPGVAPARGVPGPGRPTRGRSAPARSSRHATVTLVTTGFPPQFLVQFSAFVSGSAVVGLRASKSSERTCLEN